jgi:hypothetical protein
MTRPGTLLGSQLLERYSILNASYQEWLLDYFELQANYTSLLLGHAQNIRSLTYVFIATTTIFIIAAAYLQHTHSVYTEVEKRVNSQVIDPKGYMHM